jgi:hypothetical protein
VTETARVRPAEDSDRLAIADLADRVAAHLLERGTLDWRPSALEPPQGLFVLEERGTVTGTVAVRLEPGTGHLSFLMAVPGGNRGRRLLAWAERYVAGTGRQVLRLDCSASNRRLLRYYQEAGYGIVVTTDDGMVVFEKRLIPSVPE